MGWETTLSRLKYNTVSGAVLTQFLQKVRGGAIWEELKSKVDEKQGWLSSCSSERSEDNDLR